MKRFFIAALSLTVPVLPVSSQCADADKKALEAFDKAWSEATTRGDRAQLQGFFADDYEGATLIGTVNKTAAIDGAVRAAELNRANPQGAPRTIYDNYVITCTPVSATVTHRNTITTTVNGRDQITYSRSVHVLEKRGGRWQVVGNAGHPLTDVQILTYLESDWNEAIKRHDATWLERNMLDDATDVSSRTGAIQNKAQAVAEMRRDKSVVESMELSEVAVRVDGNTAVVTGVYRERGRDEQNRPYDRRARFTDTWLKRDGRWQIWAAQGTAIQ
ncbi:MAG TPA: nuclear transport factor 2 family protein [Gemmatimonadaceae bacterium]|nr:nuclear transport factor 2 family protein [Gemmatimonadaceae bacterium]